MGFTVLGHNSWVPLPINENLWVLRNPGTLVDKATDRLVGAHMVGSEAGEIIQGLAVAFKAGVTKSILDSTIGIHPTTAEEFVTMREPAS